MSVIHHPGFDPVQESKAYRLKVRIGEAEFDGDGPEETVRSDYQEFIEMIRLIGTSRRQLNEFHTTPDRASEESDDSEDSDGLEEMWANIYCREGNELSLYVLPETKTKNGDALLLLIYGYQKLLGSEGAKSTDLMESAKQSGLRIDRVDRNIPAELKAYVITGGSGKGTRYRLNNRGLAYAANLLETMLD